MSENKGWYKKSGSSKYLWVHMTKAEQLSASAKSYNRLKAKRKKLANDLKDDENPKLAFQTMSTKLIVSFIKGTNDIDYYLRYELANRGLNINGEWIGFEKAKEEHKI